MKVKVNKDVCIGCGACEAITKGEFFTIGDDGFAEVIEKYQNKEVPEEMKEDVESALDSCPTSAIEEV